MPCTQQDRRRRGQNDTTARPTHRQRESRIKCTIDDHDNYDLVWQRLNEEYGYVYMQSQSKISKMLDIPSMKSANPKELITFAQQLHDSVSKLAKRSQRTVVSGQNPFHDDETDAALTSQVGRKML